MAQVYVDNGGTGGSGTYADPYGIGELSTAITAATNTGAEDGIVILKDGTYTSAGTGFNNPYLGVSVLIKAENPLAAVFTQTTLGILTSQSYNLTVEGVKNVSITAGTGTNPADTLVFSTSDTITFKACWFRVNISGSEWIRSNTATTQIALLFQDCLLELSLSVTGAGVFRQTSSGGFWDVALYNCTVILLSGWVDGCRLIDGYVSADIQGSIIYKIGTALTLALGFPTDYDSSGDKVRNTCIYGNSAYSANTTHNIITSDPFFVDAANGDYDLRPDSPCINQVPLTYEAH